MRFPLRFTTDPFETPRLAQEAGAVFAQSHHRDLAAIPAQARQPPKQEFLLPRPASGRLNFGRTGAGARLV